MSSKSPHLIRTSKRVFQLAACKTFNSFLATTIDILLNLIQLLTSQQHPKKLFPPPAEPPAKICSGKSLLPHFSHTGSYMICPSPSIPFGFMTICPPHLSHLSG